jgi:hypothetical protein
MSQQYRNTARKLKLKMKDYETIFKTSAAAHGNNGNSDHFKKRGASEKPYYE